ncbi:MAG: DMT family transporter [Rhodoferax sp.]|nr:DMT family transporter [Rhodoferax sp.]
MVAVTLLWSTAGVVTRHLAYAQKFEVTFWRSFVTMLCLLVLLPAFKGRGVFGRMRREGAVLWFSGLCWCGMMTFFMVAIMLTTVANVLVTMALIPLLTALASSVLLGHRIALRTWLAIVAAGGGIAYMYASQLNQGISLAGTLVALCLTVAGAANWTINQYAQAHGRNVDLIPAVLIGAALSALLMLPLAWPFQASAHDMVLLIGLGVGQLAIPCVLVVVCARVLNATEVALLGLLEVIFGILLVWFGAGEVPTHDVLLGGSLVIGALVVNELLGWRSRAVLLS